MTVAPGPVAAHFPPAEIAKFRAIVQSTLPRCRPAIKAAPRPASPTSKPLGTDDESTLRPMDETTGACSTVKSTPP